MAVPGVLLEVKTFQELLRNLATGNMEVGAQQLACDREIRNGKMFSSELS